MGLAPALTPDALKRQAERIAGLHEWGGRDDDRDTFEAGLSILCKSVEITPVINAMGRLALHLHLLRALTNRLLRIEWMRRHSDAGRLRQPVLVVVGHPRSGTTLLHRHLAHAVDARPLRLWEVQRPLRPVRGPDHRRQQARVQVDALKRIAPDIADKHATDVDAPEECFFLLDDAMVSPSFPLLYPVEEYRVWRHTAPVAGAYRAYRAYLLALQAEQPSRRLVLKAPGHAEHLAAIAHAIPEAVFVQTHRPALQTVPSRASLVYSLHRRFSDEVDPRVLGRACLDDAVHLLRGCVGGRRALPDDRIIDVQHDVLVRDPNAVVAHIHERLALPPCAPLRQEADVHGKHRYTLAEYGLDAETLQAALGDLEAALAADVAQRRVQSRERG